MVLNNKPQMFTFYFPSNFWYDEVKETWQPFIERMKLPYQDISDFMNQQVQAIKFPALNMEPVEQQREQYPIAYFNGKELEPQIDKSLNITFKLTESYITYWVVWHQIDLFLHYAATANEKKPCWMEPVSLGFLNDAGFKMIEFEFSGITPTNTSELNMSYAATIASYNTFSLNLRYNYFDIK